MDWDVIQDEALDFVLLQNKAYCLVDEDEMSFEAQVDGVPKDN